MGSFIIAEVGVKSMFVSSFATSKKASVEHWID